jgi:hypothetical protein
MEPALMKSLVVALSLLTLSAPVCAQSGSTEGQTSSDLSGSRQASDTHHTGDVNAQGERLICRMTPQQSSQSSSHMGMRRVCHTQAEWRAISTEPND